MGLLKGRIPLILDRILPSETAVLVGTSVLVGVGTSLGGVFFIRLISWIEYLFFGLGDAWLGFLGRSLVILVPFVGGLLAGPVITYFASEAKGHGVPEVMQAIALRGGRIRPRIVVAKIVASALCIGSGGSAGREGPIVQVGAALGSTLGQWLRLSENRIRNLVACGAAAGIAATFNAPIAGVIFAMEIILGEWQLADMGNVVISALTASTVARVFLGDRPAFAIPNYGMQTSWEVLLYILLGALAALIAVAFIRILYWFENRFDTWQFPDALKPAVGGLMLGALAFSYPFLLSQGLAPASESQAGLPLASNIPHIFGSGFAVIEDALLGKLSFGLLFLLVFLKPLATSLTLGSGNSGGVFAPSLFTGAALGGAFGTLVELVAPGRTAGPGAFAIVGMAAMFAGAARAPFTAILIVFEMTNDYRLILPLMAGVITSLILADYLHPESIYTLKLVQRGINLKRGRDVDVMGSVRVDEVMVSDPISMPAELPVSFLANEFIRTGRHGFPVVNQDGSLMGVVSLQDYRQAIENKDTDPSQLTVGDITTREVVSVFPEDTVDVALRKMAPRDLSRLPVVDRSDPKRLLGVVRRNDIVRAYEVGVMRYEEARLRTDANLRVRNTRIEFIETTLEPLSDAPGKTVSELNLPRQAVLVAIRRNREQIIPHGDTQLLAGDVVTSLCEHSCAQEVREELRQWQHKPAGP